MHADLFILQICDFLDDGDGFYRLHEPSRQLSRLPGVVVVDCHFYHRLAPALAEAADVVVLPFIHDWDLFPLIERRRAAGKITVFEANDYFYDVQPWSPIGAQWQDRAIQEEYRHYMAAADAVQTSTPALARHWRERSRQVAVFMNQLTEVPPLAPPPARALTIGWGGSPSHFADWYEVAPVLETWLADHPTVHLAVMTNEFAQPFIRLPPERYHFTPFGSLASYLRFLPSLDIGVAPLLPTGYNRGRSDVKFLEYAAHGVAGIYTDLEPYRDTVVSEKTGLFYENHQELRNCLDQLAGDPALRQRIRTQAHAHVLKNRRIPDHIGERLTFYRQLFRQPPGGNEVPEEAVAAAVRDGRYLQLRPQPPEQTLIEVVQKPASREGTQVLVRLVEQHPTYHAALQHLGRQLNDLKEPASSIAYLDRAHALNPQSARTLCERGRARFQLNDIAGARHDMEAALALNPSFYPGWQYLLRLMDLTRSQDGPATAARARQLFPADFAVALAGVRTYPADRAVPVMRQLLEDFGPTFSRDELTAAASIFGEAIAGAINAAPAAPDALALLERACQIFPQSARFASLIGTSLHGAGRYAESNAQYVRALHLRRTSLAYRAEFPKEDGTIHYWQFAEHIRRWRQDTEKE
jgi:tetratricopeptide (TPR) repeat protein